MIRHGEEGRNSRLARGSDGLCDWASRGIGDLDFGGGALDDSRARDRGDAVLAFRYHNGRGRELGDLVGPSLYVRLLKPGT